MRCTDDPHRPRRHRRIEALRALPRDRGGPPSRPVKKWPTAGRRRRLGACLFPGAWRRGRMTWVKPSFLWMMYRCGWGLKEGQQTVLAVEISREGFEWALRNACLSHYVRGFHADQAAWKRELRQAPARVQWDPERDLRLGALPYRSLQLGLAGEASRRYADEWIVGIRDVTPLAHEVHGLVRQGRIEEARAKLPEERAYPAGAGLLGQLVA
ncbi:DUF4291 domain-containing protein [Streptomyces sp. NPDC015346]|uniref:DUF4291 domain-containing protein n=1 Tax=Streptomyces sp. NPDC015346 TaxID=3364954 RepID=UPI0036FE97D5